MAEQSHQERTEAPTQHRRDKARREGQIPQSSELSNATVLLAALVFLKFGAGGLGAKLLELFRRQVADMDRSVLTIDEMPSVMQAFLQTGLSICLPLLAVVATIGIFISTVQTGVVIASEPLKPKWSKLSPASNVKRLFSLRSVVRTTMMLMRVAASLAVLIWMLDSRKELLARLGRESLSSTLIGAWDISFSIAIGMASVYFVMGAFDYAYQRFQHERDLRMTKQEIKDEHKQMEGSQEAKGRMRKQQQEVAKQRMLLNVPTATFIVRNPTHYAVALRYVRNSKSAPVVVAKGRDALARRIIRIAREHGITVIERKPLARALYAMVEVDQEIPPELYKAIAKILAYVYGIRRKRRRSA